MLKKILVPLDGSALSERAIGPAQAIAEKFCSQLVLLRVPVVENQMAMAYNANMGYEPDYKAYQDQAEGYLYSWQLKLNSPVVQVTTEVVSGQPANTILTVAEAVKADMIIMSTHGRSGIGRLVYGSVAESVLRGSHIPVMLIPLKEEATAI